MISTVDSYYFSPTGGTQKVADIFCGNIASNLIGVNLCAAEAEVAETTGDLIVVSAPVYGGRIPSVIANKLRKLDGTGKKAVAIVVYGNRDFDDALLELKNLLEERGCRVIGAGAFVAQHALVPEVGLNRPDDIDQQQICEFAVKILKSIEEGTWNQFEVPGNMPYTPEMNMPASPITMDTCISCGLCKKACPTGAITIENNTISTNVDKCILCMACSSVCPKHARILPPPLLESLEGMLESCKYVRADNKYFM